MSKCEHGQKITMFCATDCCVWREAGGCAACMKKYHNHMGPTVFITQEEISKLVKKYNVEPGVKHRCRSLQEAIFNYFNTIKSQINAFIDSACIDIMNQIGHPYLSQNNLFTTYKRLKKKDYKKIQQKDFRHFFEMSRRTSDEQLIQKQSKIYLEKVKQKLQLINSIEKSIRGLEKANKDHQQTYFGAHDGSINLKINQIVKSIIKNSQKSDVNDKKSYEVTTHAQTASQKDHKKSFSKQSSENPKVETLSKQTNDDSMSKPKEEIKLIETKDKERIRPGRLSSLDKQFTKTNKLSKNEKQKQSNDISINWHVQNDPAIDQENINESDSKSPKRRYFDTKQVEISQKKQKLIDMMKQKEELAQNRLKPHFEIKPIQKSDHKISEKSGSNIDGSGDSLDQKDENYNFFAHTALPRTESKKKIFQQTQEVAQKTVIVPVNSNIQPTKIEECMSPLMKNMFMSKEMPKNDDEKPNFSIVPQKIKSKQNLMNETELDDRKQKSIALLVKSMSLKIEDAIPYLEKSLEFSEDNLSAAEYLSYLYLEIDRPKQCLNLCNKMFEKFEGSPEKLNIALHLIINKSSALNMLGRYSESIVVLEECLKNKPHEKIYKNLGDAYFSIGILEKAGYYYEKAVSKADSYDEAHYNLAVCLFSQQNYYNAKFSIMKALQSNPKNQAYQQLQRQILLRIKQY